MKPFRISGGRIALLCSVLLCRALSLAIPDNVWQPPVEATSSFPVFLRSRFNPRMLQTNESQPQLSLPSSDERPFEPSVTYPPNGDMLSTPSGSTAGEDAVESAGTLRVSPERSTTRTTIVDERVRQALTMNLVAGDALDSTECGIGGGDGEDFPWIAVLEHGDPEHSSGRKRTLSKGVLIDRQHVLTTVSSVQNSYPSWVVTGVRLGDTPTHRDTTPASFGRRRLHSINSTLLRLPIGMVFLHESKDIALIRLAGEGVRTVGEHVRPICLPREDHRLEAFTLASHVCEKQHAPAKHDPNRRRASHSKLQPVELLTGDECNRLLEPYGARLVGKSFCAWENATDNCTGPLGGPVVAKIRGKYHVVGLRSYLQTETEVDGAELPSIYIRIGGFRKWISAVIRAIHD